MIIELAGLPGSGKSTIARRLIGTSASLRSTVVKPRVAAFLDQPMLLGSGLLPGSSWPAWLSLCARRAAQDEIPDPGRTTILMLEEGIVHHTWRSRFMDPGLDRRPWAALLDVTAPLVVLVAPPAVRHARVSGKARGGPVNRQLAAGTPGDATWERAEALMTEVVAAAGRHRRVAMVNTEGGLEEAVARVAEAVGALR